ncbi:MAG: MFS transporter [Burkholderiales bacterium]|jgi:ATP-dependent protease HslVU (ClpYQ) peptidase subunit|nr:MFS transporter [Burkholderiales bacterium]MCA3153616.1 MFS transporter [Burkholderiales bacterium]MCA3156136.1 MFS transporter [Burkholderiales bacterium]MCA3158479.1 MFS transporter [Burkholderiales bacterium]MCA3161373.1 MFS transporter [Burkholderiales bacterium]
MTTVVVVKRGDQVAIASDSLVTFGDTRLAHGYETNNKIIEVNGSYLGLAGSTAHFAVLERALRELGDDCKLGSRDEVFTTFQKIHPILKEKFFLNTKEEEDDPYESSQMTCLIANPSGIYGVYSYREVFCFERFWGIGSGRNFALGALYAAYDKTKNAAALAQIGVEAGIEFDKSSSGPVRVVTVKLKPKKSEERT